MAQRPPDAAEELDSDVDIMATSSLQVLQHRPHFNNTDLPTGFLFSPLSIPLGEIPHSPEAPPQCSHCGAFANMYCTFQHSVKSWVCNFCGSTSVYSATFSTDSPCATSPDFDVLPVDASAALLDAHTWPSIVFLLIDATLDEDLLQEVTEASKDLIHRLPPSTLISLITFDSAVTLYDLSPDSATSSSTTNTWVLPGDTRATPAMLQRLTAACEGFIAPVHTCTRTVCAALDSLHPLHTLHVPRARPRCTGAALDAARLVYDAYTDVRVIDVPPEPSIRVMTMLGGPCTRGPGSASTDVVDSGGAAADGADQFLMLEAQRFVAELAAALHGAGIVVDIISGGLNASNLALWDRVVSATGGALTIQEGFGGLLSANLAAMLQRAQAAAVSLDFAASEGLAVENVIGPRVTTAVPQKIPPTFQHRTPSRRRDGFTGTAGRGGDFARSSLAACDADVLEAGQAFSVLLKSTADLEGRYVVVQGAARWRTPAGLSVMRVATRRLEVTRSFETYASSLCHPTASVLLAKSLILSAEKQGASSDPQALEDARARCASLLRSLARSAGVPAARRRGWGGFLLGAASAGFLAGAPETWLLPQCLLPVAEALYHLQRGQLLGHVVGHSDERAQLFHLFLKSDLALAQATLVPRAYQVTPEEDGVTPTRPCDLILDANTVIVLDCGTQIFLWLGSNLDMPGDAAAAVRRESLRALAAASGAEAAAVAAALDAGDLVAHSVHVAHACAVGRVPVPELRVCLEGTGDERYVLSRLAPTTTDEEEDIQAQLPHLAAAYAEDAAYTEQMIAHIVRRLPRSDDPSLVAWATQAGVDIRPALLGQEDDVDGANRSGSPAGSGGIAQARQAAERLSGAAAAAAQGRFRLVAPKAERNPFGRRRQRSVSGGGAVAGDAATSGASASQGSFAGGRSGAQSPVADPAAPRHGALPTSSAAGAPPAAAGAPVDDHLVSAQRAVSDPHGRPAVSSANGPYAPQPVSDARPQVSQGGGFHPGIPPVSRPQAPGMPGRPSSARAMTGPPPPLGARTRPASAGVAGPGAGIARPPLAQGGLWAREQASADGAQGGPRAAAAPPPVVPPGMQAMQRARS